MMKSKIPFMATYTGAHVEFLDEKSISRDGKNIFNKLLTIAERKKENE